LGYERVTGFGPGGGRSGVGGAGGDCVPGTGSPGSGGRGGGSRGATPLTNLDWGGLDRKDMQEGEDAQRGEHHQKAADDKRRDAMPGEDGESQEQKDDGNQDVREIDLN
jgi:hypothetical protein